MNNKFRLAAVAGAVALIITACGEAPDEGGDTATEGAGGDSDFLACMVSDQGGVNDKSFNESSWNGLQNAAEAGEIGEPKFAESQSDADYAPNVDAMVADDCGLIVTVGFLLAGATQEAAEANTDEKFAIVDYKYSAAVDGVDEIDNVKPIVFNTHEAAFLAGYVSAGYSQTGRVATWGGAKIPTVTIFMDGFYDGVQHYNEVNGTAVEVLGWDKTTQEGQFVGDFENTGLAKQISDNLISQGADVLLPVAGPLAASAATAAQENEGVAVVWVDSDGYESAPEYGDVILTSVMKGMDVAVEDVASQTAAGDYSNEPYIGTLENEGVSLAPYHDFDAVLDQELKDAVEDLKQEVVDGTITVESDAAYK